MPVTLPLALPFVPICRVVLVRGRDAEATRRRAIDEEKMEQLIVTGVSLKTTLRLFPPLRPFQCKSFSTWR